jgi:iron complex transport system ATP-binding protein
LPGAPADAAPALRLSGASVLIADGTRLLGPVDLEVRAGERLALLGRNGSGKTTLLTLAGGRRQPSSGTVDILGARVGSVDLRVLRRRIGHVGHRLTDEVRPALTAEEVVLTGRDSVLVPWFAEFTDDDRAEARSRLEQVGCAGLADRELGTLSQGERGRVLLARALFGRPDLLLLDEPMAGLDLPSRERMVAALETIDGPTLIMATHHLEELPATTTRAALLRDGALVAEGPAGEVLSAEPLSRCFGIPVAVSRNGSRWSATSRG